ncbi:MAG: hypothetical protein ACE5NP_00180 [Anaerolineae bacterium]
MPEEKVELTWDEHFAKGMAGLWKEMMAAGEQFLPPEEFRRHCRAAGKEALLAVRSLFDTAIERLEEEKPAKKKATKIKVE